MPDLERPGKNSVPKTGILIDGEPPRKATIAVAACCRLGRSRKREVLGRCVPAYSLTGSLTEPVDPKVNQGG